MVAGRSDAVVSTFQLRRMIPQQHSVTNFETGKPLVLVGRGGAAFTAASVWQRMGQLARITNCRIPEAEKLLSIWHAQVWAKEPADLLVGTAWSAVEVGDF